MPGKLKVSVFSDLTEGKLAYFNRVLRAKTVREIFEFLCGDDDKILHTLGANVLIMKATDEELASIFREFAAQYHVFSQEMNRLHMLHYYLAEEIKATSVPGPKTPDKRTVATASTPAAKKFCSGPSQASASKTTTDKQKTPQTMEEAGFTMDDLNKSLDDPGETVEAEPPKSRQSLKARAAALSKAAKAKAAEKQEKPQHEASRATPGPDFFDLSNVDVDTDGGQSQDADISQESAVDDQ